MLNLSHVLEFIVDTLAEFRKELCILWFRQTLSAVLSTKLIPVHPPIRHFFWNRMNGTITFLSNSVNLL